MRSPVLVDAFATLLLAIAASLAACDGVETASAPASDAGPCDADVLTTPDGESDALDAQDAHGPGALILSLDATLDGEEGAVKASAIIDAQLRDGKGAKVATATVASGRAVFALGAVKVRGDYFIEVNGDSDDLVPTRIDDPSAEVTQRVGTKLRASVIGPVDAPLYRVKTYPAGEEEIPVVRFSDGGVVEGEHPYVIVGFAPPKVEFRVLGTAALLSSLVPNATHTGEPFDVWLINTEPFLHHGDAFKAQDGGAPMCSACHAMMDTKPVTFEGISLAKGTCFRCHHGTNGEESGFVDSKK